MVICHISDTHGAKFHSKLRIPECDVLIHSGDIGNRTNNLELAEFLIWFSEQPAKKKIFIAGNHDLILDKNWVETQKERNSIVGMIAEQMYEEGQKLLKKFDVEYLLNSGCEYEGIKFWGSPYSPSFHREHWAFNADKGREISRYWDMIPTDTDVLIVHTPPFGIQDWLNNGQERQGCLELNIVVSNIQPLLFLCGHIHEGYGYEVKGRTTYVNSSVLNKEYVLTNEPFLIEISTINEGFKEVKILNE